MRVSRRRISRLWVHFPRRRVPLLVFVVGLDFVCDGASPIALDAAPRDVPAGIRQREYQ
jgi:hypothetical protein